MRWAVLSLVAASAMACVSLPRPVSMTSRPSDVLLLQGEWRGEFNSEDRQRGGAISFALEVQNDTAKGTAVLMPAHIHTHAEATAPPRPEQRAVLRSAMHFVSVTDGIVTGVVPPYYDEDRLSIVQMTFVGRIRSWNVIEGTYIAVGPNLRVEERGSWRVVRDR